MSPIGNVFKSVDPHYRYNSTIVLATVRALIRIGRNVYETSNL